MTSTMASLSRMAKGGNEPQHRNASVIHFPLTVNQEKFHIRLKTSREKYPVVSGFDKDADGLPGEVQASGRVVTGDYLKSVNGISLQSRPFKQCVSIIRRECQFSGPKELIFFRIENVATEESSWQTKSPMYSAYSTQVLSALRDRTDLDMDIAREFSKLGLPDEGGVRSVMWKVLLGFLPPAASSWDASLARSRASYQDLLTELIVDPWAREDPQPLPPRPASLRRTRPSSSTGTHFAVGDQHHSPSTGGDAPHLPLPRPLFNSPSLARKTPTKASSLLVTLLETGAAGEVGCEEDDASLHHQQWQQQSQQQGEVCALPVVMQRLSACRVSDDPLNVSETSAWRRYWDDWLLYESIEKDVIRTHPCLHFFAENNGDEGAMNVHHAALQRILYLYAKLNPGIKYVQGMNELVGTLYYVFGNHMSYEPWREHVEADTFFCFSLLMIDTRDLFIRNLDDAGCGIGGRIQDFVDTLQQHDPEVAARLEQQGIAPSFYSLRWITTLFTREFDLFDTIRLWDSLFADSDRHDLLCCMCCTMVMEQREELLAGDFTSNLTLLQHYPPVHISYFLSRVDQLRAQGKSKAALRSGKRGAQTRSDEWNITSQNSSDTKRGNNGSNLEGSQPLMGQLLTGIHSSINDNNWLSGVRQSLFSGHGAASTSARVPPFQLCRNSDLHPQHGKNSSSSSAEGVVIPTFERLLARTGVVGAEDSSHDGGGGVSEVTLNMQDETVISFDEDVSTDCNSVRDDRDADDNIHDNNLEGKVEYHADPTGTNSTASIKQGNRKSTAGRTRGRHQELHGSDSEGETDLFEPMWVFGSPLE